MHICVVHTLLDTLNFKFHTVKAYPIVNQLPNICLICSIANRYSESFIYISVRP